MYNNNLGTANFNKNYGLINKNLIKDTKKALSLLRRKKLKTIDSPKNINKKTLNLIAARLMLYQNFHQLRKFQTKFKNL